MFHLSEVNADSMELAELVNALDAFQNQLYPAESNHGVDLSAVGQEKVRCIVVHDDNNHAVACGAVLFQDGEAGEIKRVYVDPASRGNRLGEQVVARLEVLAYEAGLRLLRLETGIHQHAAIRLYEKCGYHFCPPFPPYKADPLSLFMAKSLR